MDSRQENSISDKTSNLNVRRKEKRRTESINKAFSELRKCIPNVPYDTKLSKIKTLHLASSYILYLSEILESGSPRDQNSGGEFNINSKAQVAGRSKGRKPNFSDKLRIIKSLNGISIANRVEPRTKSPGESSFKKAKGRTGWPVTVWAEVLENDSKRNDSKSRQCSTIDIGEPLLLGSPLCSSPNPFHPYPENVPSLGLRTRSYYSDVELVLNRLEQFQPSLFDNQNHNNTNAQLGSDYNGDFSDHFYSNSDESSNTMLYPQYNSELIPETIDFHQNLDLVHSSAVSFPLVPINPTDISQPLPSISTLCCSYKTRPNIDPMESVDYIVGGKLNDYNQNGGDCDESQFTELQPVSQVQAKYIEL